jgi:hypothetical protein
VLDAESAPDDLTRPLYLLFETVHVAVYVTPEPPQAYRALGLPTGYAGHTGYAGYIGSRAAPMGPVPAAVVDATFAVFSPELVRACVPMVWEVASPEQFTAARYAGVGAGLRRIVGGRVADPALAEAADLLREAVQGLSTVGRPLFAAQAAVPAPTEPVLAVWHWCTALREHRGDGHVAALLDAGLGALDSLVLHAAADGPRTFLQTRRGFSPQEWAAGEDHLRNRGLVGPDGSATDDGRRLRAAVERRTEAAAGAPWAALGRARSLRLAELLTPVAEAVRAADVDGGSAHRVGR